MGATWPQWLKDLMGARGLNNKGLAKLLFISPSTVGDWKKGKYKPDNLSIIKLAELAGENSTELFAMIYEQPLPTDRPPRTLEQIFETMPLDELIRLNFMIADKLRIKQGEG